METFNDFKKKVGKRREFCLLGPEYFDCCNTGKRARIVAITHGGYSVGLEEDYWNRNWKNITFFGHAKRRQALALFWEKCQPAMEFNEKAKREALGKKAMV